MSGDVTQSGHLVAAQQLPQSHQTQNQAHAPGGAPKRTAQTRSAVTAATSRSAFCLSCATCSSATRSPLSTSSCASPGRFFQLLPFSMWPDLDWLQSLRWAWRFFLNHLVQIPLKCCLLCELVWLRSFVGGGSGGLRDLVEAAAQLLNSSARARAVVAGEAVFGILTAGDGSSAVEIGPRQRDASALGLETAACVIVVNVALHVCVCILDLRTSL